jgi:hypothetical protein
LHPGDIEEEGKKKKKPKMLLEATKGANSWVLGGK